MATKRTAKRKKTATTAGAKQNKAAFVRSLPESTPAKEVVAKAKASGVTLSENYVYNVRATTKASKKKRTRAATKTSPATPAAVSSSGEMEKAFRRMVLDLGLARARALLNEVERGLQAVIAGR